MDRRLRDTVLQHAHSSCLSIHANNPQTCHHCWDWDCSMLLQYIKERETKFVQDPRNPESMRTLVNAVVQRIIIPCFDKKRSCIIENRNSFLRALTGKKCTRRRVYVEYFVGQGKVPLHNIYSALGWLISVADPLPASDSSPPALRVYQDALKCYARLCQTLSFRIGAHTRPTTVHLLLIASPSATPSCLVNDLPALNGALFGTGDLSAALVTFQCNIPRVQITVTDDDGISRIVEKGPHSRHSEVLAADLYTLRRQHVSFSKGRCDETLEFLLQQKSDIWHNLWGISYAVDKSGAEFTMREFQTRFPSPPCSSKIKVCSLFLNGFNATFVDATHALPDDWRHSRVCQTCPTIISPGTSSEDDATAQRRFAECAYGCGAVWCGDCRQEGDSKHAAACICRLKIVNAQRRALRDLQRREEILPVEESNKPVSSSERVWDRTDSVKTTDITMQPPSVRTPLTLAMDIHTKSGSSISETNTSKGTEKTTSNSKASMRWRAIGVLQDIVHMPTNRRIL